MTGPSGSQTGQRSLMCRGYRRAIVTPGEATFLPLGRLPCPLPPLLGQVPPLGSRSPSSLHSGSSLSEDRPVSPTEPRESRRARPGPVLGPVVSPTQGQKESRPSGKVCKGQTLQHAGPRANPTQTRPQEDTQCKLPRGQRWPHFQTSSHTVTPDTPSPALAPGWGTYCSGWALVGASRQPPPFHFPQ